MSKVDREKKKGLKAHRMGENSPVREPGEGRETLNEHEGVEGAAAGGDFLRSIEDAISTVIAEARQNITTRSPADERSRKKLVVKEVFMSDSEPERHDHSIHSDDDDIEIIGS